MKKKTETKKPHIAITKELKDRFDNLQEFEMQHKLKKKLKQGDVLKEMLDLFDLIVNNPDDYYENIEKIKSMLQ